MSASERGRAARSSVVPRWFFAAMAFWLLIAAAALANATSLPVRADTLAALLGATAFMHGLYFRRWLVAGPLAGMALLAAAALAFEVGLGHDNTVYQGGPADAMGIRAIWISLLVIVSAVIAWAFWLHGRLLRWRRENPSAVTPLDAADGDEVARLTEAAAERVGSIEELLSPSS